MKRKNDEWKGKKINDWTVVDYVLTEKGIAWVCECKCGRIKTQKVWNVKSGKSKMCRWCSAKERKERKEKGKVSSNGYKSDK